MGLSNLKKLEILDLSHNFIKKLDPGVWSDLSSLQELYLKRNLITELSGEIGNLSKLEVLDIRHNELVQLPPCTKRIDFLSY